MVIRPWEFYGSSYVYSSLSSSLRSLLMSSMTRKTFFTLSMLDLALSETKISKSLGVKILFLI
jgi:hypothetical protein